MRLRSPLLILGATVSALLAGRTFIPPVLDGVSFSRQVLDRQGSLLRLTLSGDEKYRLRTRLDEVDPRYIKALLLLEDQYFYRHPGINPGSVFRAFRSYLKGGESRVGGSTLTMQLARIRYGIRTRSVFGKLRQMAFALALEFKHSKKEILEAYLNTAPFGANIEGIGAASRIYFGKKPGELSLSEILLLTVIPQSPTQRNLAEGGAVFSRNLLRAKARLTKKWLASHPADRERLADLELPLVTGRLKLLPFSAPHFTELTLRKEPGNEVIRTSLDSTLQRKLQTKIESHLKARQAYGLRNAAALLVENRTGEVRALVGSRDFNDSTIQGQVNGVVARRSPGSTLKPFVYALAMERGIIHPLSLLKDTPRSFGGFDPENFDRKFAGPLSAESALLESRNVPAIELAKSLGEPGFYDFLRGTGVHLPQAERHYGLGIALGGAELSMWELAQLYSALARNGVMIPITVLARDTIPAGKKILSAEASFIVLDMLTRNPRPGRSYFESWLKTRFPVAWKTGTSFGFRDAWTAGVFGPYTLVVWLGNFDNEPNPALVGREVAAPLFLEIADSLYRPEFSIPDWQVASGLNLKNVQVCSVSGHLPGDSCPHKTMTRFIPGVSPITPCTIHRQVLVNRRTGLRSCAFPSKATEPRSFEFWPSDLLELFKLAGVVRRLPPAFARDCPLSAQGGGGQAPEITSPREEVTYLQSVNAGPDKNLVSLRAVADGDVRKIYWFINREFLGETLPEHALLFPARAGDYQVSVVDDQGRSASRRLSVRAVQ